MFCKLNGSVGVIKLVVSIIHIGLSLMFDIND